MNHQELAMQIDVLRRRAMSGEPLTLEEARLAANWLREVRGKARPEPTKKKADAGPVIPVRDLLKGL